MSTDEQFMKLALDEARNCGPDVPIGCVIVKDGAVLAVGRNQREQEQDPCGHAEIIALRAAAQKLGTWRLQDCTLYCTLEPCPMCAEAILQARVSRLVFGAYDLVYGAVGSAFDLYVRNRTYPIPEVTSGVLEQQCKQLVQTFFKRRRAQQQEEPV